MNKDNQTQDTNIQEEQNTAPEASTTETEKDFQTLQTELETMTNTAKRALADLQNFKRHADEQRTQLMSMGQIDILTKLMPVYDNLARAMSHTPEELKDNDWIKGIESIQSQFQKLLQESGLELISGKESQADPNFHEIITAIPGTPHNQIVEVLEQGYTFKGKVIKPSKVVVGSDQ